MSSATDLARAVVAELVTGGIRQVVLCPGSRSAPLAYALYDADRAGLLRVHVRHDERVAAFTALGIARATGMPAVVVTTSGTAVANLHPAVMEAHHAGVPLLLVTADRPPALRGTWANQTSDLQAEVFGGATRLTHDLGPDDPRPQWAAGTRAAIAAATGAGGGRPGPVHLNLGFDDPLIPGEGDEGGQSWLGGLHSPPPSVVAEPGGSEPSGFSDVAAGRSVVLVGAGDLLGGRAYAEAAGLPLLAEPSSARGGRQLVGPYRLLLDRPELGGRIERVVVFGRPTLSRPVSRLLARPDVEIVLVTEHPDDPGPGRLDVRRWSPAQLADQWPARPAPDTDWLADWVRAGAVAAQAIDAVLDGWPVLTGPLVAREVAVATTPGQPLVLAASNPVRDVDLAGPGWAFPVAVFANRGLSGIDGTISTAIGVALGGGQGTRALVGDLAFLHDLGALVIGPAETEPDLTVVVLNDGGGGIFSLLEPGADGERDGVAAQRFERLFGTPHTVGLGAVCEGLGVRHRVIASAAGLREALAAEPRGLQVIEVQVDRADLRPLHEAIDRSVATALDTTEARGARGR